VLEGRDPFNSLGLVQFRLFLGNADFQGRSLPSG
jgi:hypothetical protein